MNKIKFSKHAFERMKQRKITQKQVNAIIQKPDSIIKTENRIIYQALIKSDNKKTYLYRVFVNTKQDPNIVITVYKTSKSEKYL